MAKKVVAVFGGSGFVGSHLLAALGKMDYEVRLFSRTPERLKSFTVLPNLTLHDVHDFQEDKLRESLRGTDCVINLIGILNERGHRGRGFRQAHIDSVKKIVSAAKKAGATRFLQVSALGADTNAKSHYLRTKGEALNFIHGEESDDFHVTSFLPSVIFGPGDSFFNRFHTLLKFSPGVMSLPSASSQYAPVYVCDVVSIILQTIDHHQTYDKRYELCGPKVYTLKDLVKYTAEVTGQKRWILGLNNSISKLVAMVMEFIPGKPYSVDNYNSALTPSVCSTELPDYLCFKRTALETVVPFYLTEQIPVNEFNHYRKTAGRDL